MPLLEVAHGFEVLEVFENTSQVFTNEQSLIFPLTSKGASEDSILISC